MLRMTDMSEILGVSYERVQQLHARGDLGPSNIRSFGTPSNVKLGIWRPKLGIAAPLALGFVQTRP